MKMRNLSLNVRVAPELPFRWLAAQVRRLGASCFQSSNFPASCCHWRVPAMLLLFEYRSNGTGSSRFKVIPRSAAAKIIFLAWEVPCGLIHQRCLLFFCSHPNQVIEVRHNGLELPIVTVDQLLDFKLAGSKSPFFSLRK